VRGTPLPSASMSTLSPHIPEDRHSVLHASEVGTVGGRGIELAERANLLCAARSGASNHWSRSASSFGLVAQPYGACSPLPRSMIWLAGVRQSIAGKPPAAMFKPPRASGFLLCTPLLSRDWHTGRMDEICFDPSCPQPTRQPEAIAAGFEGHNDALDLAAGVDRFVTPAMQ
jgi:hypothetical protein